MRITMRNWNVVFAAILAMTVAVAVVFAPNAFAAPSDSSLAGAQATSLGTMGEGDEYNEGADGTIQNSAISFNDLALIVYDTRTVSSYYDDMYEETLYHYDYSMKPRAYTGKEICPAVKVAIDSNVDSDDYYWDESQLTYLTLGKDYSISYRNNVNVGTATVVVTGMGEYYGSTSRTFKIGYPISGASIAKIKAQQFKGVAVKPVPKVTLRGKTLRRNVDYTLSYKSNDKAGKAKVIVAGKGNYIGTATATFTIKKAPLKSAKIASIATQSYSGKAVCPTPKVKYGSVTLKQGRDYTLSYSNNKKAGTGKLTIKGKGSFTGSKTVSFKIKNAKKSSNASKKSNTSGGTVYITDTGAKYHRGSCKWLRWSKHAISKSEAIAQGYEPCKVCRP